MQKYNKNKAGWRDCFLGEERDIFYNWNSYEHKDIDNSIDLKSFKASVYMPKKALKKDNNWCIAYVSPSVNPSIEIEFKELAEKWEMETGLFSVDRNRINDTFLDIISLGKQIIPFILNDILKYKKAARWHLALKTLTKVNPVSIEDLNESNKIMEAWINWGRGNNII
jgi:hypothetical protein